jgi:hypothetical protein
VRLEVYVVLLELFGEHDSVRGKLLFAGGGSRVGVNWTLGGLLLESGAEQLHGAIYI